MAVPQAISNLQLRRAFRGYAAELMDCVETRSDAVVYVIDDNDRGISCFAGAEAAVSGCFIGLNPANHELHLLSIDNGLFKSPEGGWLTVRLYMQICLPLSNSNRMQKAKRRTA